MNYKEKLSKIKDRPTLVKRARVLYNEYWTVRMEYRTAYDRYGTAPSATKECWAACRQCVQKLRYIDGLPGRFVVDVFSCQDIRSAMVEMRSLLDTMKPLIRHLEECCDPKWEKRRRKDCAQDEKEREKRKKERERLDDACAPVVRSSSMPKTVHERLAGRFAGEKIHDLENNSYRIAKKWENVRF